MKRKSVRVYNRTFFIVFWTFRCSHTACIHKQFDLLHSWASKQHQTFLQIRYFFLQYKILNQKFIFLRNFSGSIRTNWLCCGNCDTRCQTRRYNILNRISIEQSGVCRFHLKYQSRYLIDYGMSFHRIFQDNLPLKPQISIADCFQIYLIAIQNFQHTCLIEDYKFQLCGPRIIIIIMRNTIDVIPDSKLKGIEVLFGDIGYQNGSVLKISQKDKSIFIIYSASPEISPNKCYISSKLCQLNGIVQSAASIALINQMIPNCKSAKVFVSALDWQIINNKSQKLQIEFLNQINLIWPRAIMPLFYDNNNSVSLRVDCQQLSRLGENSEIQILIEDSTQKQLKQKSKSILLPKLQNFHTTNFGNINTLRLSEKISEQLGKRQHKIFFKYQKTIIQKVPTDTFTSSVKQQLQYIKNNDVINSKISADKFPIIIQEVKNSSNDDISLEKRAANFWKINNSQCELQISNIEDNKSSKKFQFLLKSIKNFRTVLQIVSKTDNFQQLEQIKNNFCEKFLKQLEQSGQLLVYQKIPFILCENTVGYLKLFENTTQMEDPIIILGSEKIIQLRQKFLDSIQINNLYYKKTEDKFEQEKCIQLQKLNKMICFSSEEEKKFKQLYCINYEQQILDIQKNIQSATNHHILVTSFSNNGKTILHEILTDKGIEMLYIEAVLLNDTSLTMGDINIFLEMVFQRYQSNYIFIDNIDAVCQKIDPGDAHLKQQRIASKMILRKIINCSKIYGKKCIFTAKNEGKIDQQLRNYVHIQLKNPSAENRSKVLKASQDYCLEKIEEITKSSQSMSFGEFAKFVIKGINSEDKIDSLTSKFTFKKLAGAKQAKKIIKNVIERPFKYSFLFKNLPIKLSRGILLYGGSGTGKTAIGESIADEFQMKFFTVKGSDILSKYIGGSEAAVREIFEKAMAVSPSIVFFDQFETIVPRRNSSNTGVTDRIVNQFLCYLDGVASIQGVFIVASSSRPQQIDPALLRPGRIDSHIYLDYPSKQERYQLMQLYGKSIQFKFDIDKVVVETEGFSYSDLVGLIKQLRIKKSAALFKKGSKVQAREFKEIQQDFFMNILSSYHISVNKEQQKRQRKQFQFFKNGGVPNISKQKSILQ